MNQIKGLVYSTDLGETCPECTQPIKQCRCRQSNQAVVGSGQIRVRPESQGRNGKVVTAIRGLPLAATELDKLAKELKKKCGSGGTAKDGVIEIQGDHCDLIIKFLLTRWKDVKRAGG